MPLNPPAPPGAAPGPEPAILAALAAASGGAALRPAAAGDLFFLCSRLAAACRANAPLPSLFLALAEDLRERRSRRACREIAAGLAEGQNLAQALARQPGFFPPSWTAALAAGLAAGEPAETLEWLAREARFAGRLRRDLFRLLAYPLFVLAAVLGLARLFIGPLVEAHSFWQKGTQDLYYRDRIRNWEGLFTSALQAFASALRWAPLLLLGLGLALVLLWWLRRRLGAPLPGYFSLRLPFFGRLNLSFALVRFCRLLGRALARRLPLAEALPLAGLAAGNAALLRAAQLAARRAGEGQPLGSCLKGAGPFFPETLLWMLEFAQQQGELHPVLEGWADGEEERARLLGRGLPPFLAALVLIAAGALLCAFILLFFQKQLLPLFGLF